LGRNLGSVAILSYTRGQLEPLTIAKWLDGCDGIQRTRLIHQGPIGIGCSLQFPLVREEDSVHQKTKTHWERLQGEKTSLARPYSQYKGAGGGLIKRESPERIPEGTVSDISKDRER